MPRTAKSNDEPRPQRRRPARTDEERERQLISMASDLAERQILDGSASAQVITHYLKLGSTRERLEQERIRNENLVLEAKAKQMQEGGQLEQLYSAALDAMRSYSGSRVPDEDSDL